MTTFTRTITITDENGQTHQRTVTLRKMDDLMFKHYSQNPVGMDKAVRAHFKIDEGKNYSVTMECPGAPENVGCVWI